ncbi:MAG: alkaline phosphatase [Chloroflexi bacterium]|nr:alkaline phosphatase [Chloroflexota bacterium]
MKRTSIGWILLALGVLALGLGACQAPETLSFHRAIQAAYLAPHTPVGHQAADAQAATREAYPRVFFAVIGDFGVNGPNEAAVAHLVHERNPDFIVTVGDNNYPNGTKLTWEDNVLRHYGDYIERQAFFPALGNHDWGYGSPQSTPYQIEALDYLPGNRRYYDFLWGPVHFFVLDSNWQEPDGITADSKQAQWLRERLASSPVPWQVVILHHAPYSSGMHGPQEKLQWPYAEWGADVVIAGHDHTYERIHRDGILYLVNGIGGASLYNFEHGPVEGSVVRFNKDYGALFVWADGQQMRFEMHAVERGLIDSFSLP